MSGGDISSSCVGATASSEAESAMRAHGDELLNFLRRRARTPDDAADLRQDVLVRMLSMRVGGRIDNARAYLFQVARRLLIDHRRRAQVESRIFEGNAAVLDSPCGAPSPEAEASGAAEVLRLESAVAGLSENQRMALLWNRLDGLSLREIGSRLGVTESMACRYVNEALAHVHRAMRRAEQAR